MAFCLSDIAKALFGVVTGVGVISVLLGGDDGKGLSTSAPEVATNVVDEADDDITSSTTKPFSSSFDSFRRERKDRIRIWKETLKRCSKAYRGSDFCAFLFPILLLSVLRKLIC